uniref:Putative secreted protein n=1 Tax=Ixodes ricinus TaxID=34613 RepID=A0A6B0UKE8_IXORI
MLLCLLLPLEQLLFVLSPALTQSLSDAVEALLFVLQYRQVCARRVDKLLQVLGVVGRGLGVTFGRLVDARRRRNGLFQVRHGIVLGETMRQQPAVQLEGLGSSQDLRPSPVL